MPLHQISVIPRDVTSSRVSGSGKAKDKDKQVCEGFRRPEWSQALQRLLYLLKVVFHIYSIYDYTGPEQRGSD